MNFVVIIFALLVSASMLNGCAKGSGDSASLGSSSPGTGGGDIGTIDAKGIWIDVADNDGLFDPLIHQSSSFSSACRIEASVTLSSGDMDCNVDILETENYYYDVKLQYNIPQNACDFVHIKPSWHWNESWGYGPSSVTIEQNNSGQVVDMDGDGDGGCGTVQNGVGVPCASAAEIYGMDSSGFPICEYNYQSREEGGVNCCFGTYDLTVGFDANDNGTIDANEWSVSNGRWGGNAGSCYGGFAKNSWSVFYTSGIPAVEIKDVGAKGLNSAFELKSNAESVGATFQYAANYYNQSGNPHNHSGFVSSSTSNLPYAFDPVDDLDGTLLPAGRVPYVVECMDKAGEIKHRINIYVREWNTYSQFLTYQSTSGVSGNSDLSGAEGVACEYEANFGGQCNDYDDWDDILSDTGGSYDTSTIDKAKRRSWFPRIRY